MLRSKVAEIFRNASTATGYYSEFHDKENWPTWGASQRWYAFPLRSLVY